MVRRMIAGAAVAGAMTFGLGGLAGATTPTTAGTTPTTAAPTTAATTPTTAAPTNPAAPSNTSTTVPHVPKSCPKLPKIKEHAANHQKKASARLSKEQALQKKLKSEGGHTKQLKGVDAKIKKIQKSQAKYKKRLNKLETKCPASDSSGSTTPTTASA